MSSIRDVAKKAGVSLSSVSLAYHKPYQLSKKTREKILTVAESLGYSPNPNKMPKMVDTIAIAVPFKGIKQTQIPLVAKFTETLSSKEYRTTIIDYHTVLDLMNKMKSLESDKNIKGLIIVYNEKEEIILQKHHIPVIVVSPHTFSAQSVDIGCAYVDDVVEQVRILNRQGKIKVGVVIEKQYMDLDYLQKVKEQIMEYYQKELNISYSDDILCILEGKNEDFETIQQFHTQYIPEFWIFLGSYTLNVAQNAIDSTLEGFILLEEDMVYSIKSNHKLKVLKRPLTQLVTTTIDTLFDLIDKKQNTIKERVLIITE